MPAVLLSHELPIAMTRREGSEALLGTFPRVAQRTAEKSVYKCSVTQLVKMNAIWLRVRSRLANFVTLN